MAPKTLSTPKLANEPKPIDHTMPPLRLGIYGDGGVGKTSLALSFPNPLVVNCDAGLEGGAIEGVTDAEQWRPDRWSDIVALYFWLKAQIEKKGYKTIVIDSISSFAILILHEAMEAPMGGSVARGANALNEELTVAQQPDYNKVATAVANLLDKLLALSVVYGVHIVITSGVREPDIEKGRTKRSFDVQPAVENMLTQWCNTFGELIAREVPDPESTATKPPMIEERVLWTKVSDRVRKNKTRFAALTPGVVNPTYAKLEELIEARLAETTPSKGSK